MRTFELEVKLERASVWHSAQLITATNFRAALDSKLIPHYIDEWKLANGIDDCIRVDWRLKAENSIKRP
jgi:hypothetical protein